MGFWTKGGTRVLVGLAVLACLVLGRGVPPLPAARAAGEQAGTIYYVSSSVGDDDNDGLSPDTALASIARVNALDLQPGDQVLFKCGNVWRAEQLIVSASGELGNQIVFGSYPQDCPDRPALSGAQPIGGWVLHAGDIYVTDLSYGGNAGLFDLGVNQLFRDGEHLPLGRWPNLGSSPNGGYATVEGQPQGHQLLDNDLPAGDWAGAAIHLKTQRWLLVNREVTASAGQTLTLNESVECRDGCAGWGYFINNHVDTLDQDGEWYYDAATSRLYLVSAGGPPANVEGSVILDEDTRYHGGIMLGQAAPAIAYVTIENLAIQDWFNHGIGAPGSMRGDVYHHVTIHGCLIQDVDAAGIKLNTWIWSADNGRDGLRGGHHMAFRRNVIDGANHFGITGYYHSSIFEDNQIKNIGLIENLGQSGMGCGTTGASCTENGDGIRIRRYLVEDSGHSNTIRYNRFERTGYNSIDVFGPNNTIEYNAFHQPCYSKGDCGAVRTFGDDSLAATQVYNIHIRDNVIVDSVGNVDGVKADFQQLFGMGLYIDHYSRDVEISGNSVVSATLTGILYQHSSGQIRDNVLYNAASGSMYSGLVGLAGSETQVSAMRGNVLYGLAESAWTLYKDTDSGLSGSDYNAFFHPYVDKQISVGGWSGRMTLAEWQAYGGMDGHSFQNWFTLNPGDAPLSRVFYNDTRNPVTVDLGNRKYLDLLQQPVQGSITLQPFTATVLIDDGLAAPELYQMVPHMLEVDEAADFTLWLYGEAFGPDCVVRWNGAARPSRFVSSTRLTATIFVSDVSVVGGFPVTVYDAASGTETAPLTFRVVSSIWRVYLPLARND